MQRSEFWNWFKSVAPLLSRPDRNKDVLQSLDQRLNRINPNLSWEIGPGKSKPWQFVVSPNLNSDLRMAAKAIIAEAPSLPDWEFYAARQPKDWKYKFNLSRSQGEPIQIDSSSWGFLLLEYPDKTREIVLYGQNLPALDENEKWQAAAITLESIVGEEVLLERVDCFALESEIDAEFLDRIRPIQQLGETLGV